MSTVRDRVRAELVEEITRLAREQLATRGATGLSLRAIARELGMVSSAVYRYVPSRDALLTILIVDAYEALGDAVDAAEHVVGRDDLTGRWRAICGAVRWWAHEHPAEYALIYGTPVPGYRAPEDTVDPATRVAATMVTLLVDGLVAGVLETGDPRGVSAVLRRELVDLAERMGAEVPPDVLARGLRAWITIFGAVSFELFGHLHNVIDHVDEWFGEIVDETASSVGFR